MCDIPGVVRTEGAQADVAHCDELLAEHGDDPDLHWREEIADALLRKGAALAWDLDRPEEAIEVWNEVHRRYGGAPERELQDDVIWALTKKALTLVELKRTREADAVYRDVMARRLPDWSERRRTLLARAELAVVWLAVKLRFQGPAGKAELWARRNLLGPRKKP